MIARLLKIHYLKQKENERLEKQMMITEVEIIKTHFRPHFLSDTLQNISYLIRNRATQSPDAILKLAYFSAISWVSKWRKNGCRLEKKSRWFWTYLDLEKTFYGERIIINFKQQGDIDRRQRLSTPSFPLSSIVVRQSLLSL